MFKNILTDFLPWVIVRRQTWHDLHDSLEMALDKIDDLEDDLKEARRNDKRDKYGRFTKADK